MANLVSTLKLPAYAGPEQPLEDRMHWLRVPYDVVLELYRHNILNVQRNHLRRANMARHLTDSELPVHINYQAVRGADGKIKLVDGYTRITVIEAGQKPKPSKVWLGVIDVNSVEGYEAIYNAIDSNKAVKRGRDAFEEGLRRASLLGKLESPVFMQGSAVSAVLAAADTKDVRKAVLDMKKAIHVLDPVKLPVGKHALPAGALAGCLLLAAHEEDKVKVQQFTAALVTPDAVPKDLTTKLRGAIKLAEWLRERREEGSLSGKNVPVIMAQVLGSWRWQEQGGKLTSLSKDDYLKEVA